MAEIEAQQSRLPGFSCPLDKSPLSPSPSRDLAEKPGLPPPGLAGATSFLLICKTRTLGCARVSAHMSLLGRL